MENGNSYSHIVIPTEIETKLIDQELLYFRKEKFFDTRREQIRNNVDTDMLLRASDELYSNIEVSTQEKEIIVSMALFEYRKKEHHRQETAKYWERISRPKEFPKLDYQQTFELFKKRVLLIEPSFQFSDQNKEVIKLLCMYFSNDERFESKYGYKLDKGIMLAGSVGCGKTTIMRAFMINSCNSFSFATCRNVVNEYMHKDNQDNTINTYSKLVDSKPHVFLGQKDVGYCFDDLGTESVKKNYGNESDVMSEIIYLRYERRLKNKTHFTTNTNGSQLKEMYGERLYSRIIEMCNYITFGNSVDYRKL